MNITNASLKNNKEKLLLFAIAIGLLGSLLYIGSKNENGRMQQAAQNIPSEEQTKEEQKILDCAKKLDQDELAMGRQENCLFLGCGDFFQ